MDLINCPLQSFAVCSNPHAQDAEIERAKRFQLHQSKGNKFHNKEASWKRNQNRNVIGLSRAKSDIHKRKLDIVGKGRQVQLAVSKQYYVADSTVKTAEGGRSRTAGRNDYLKLLDKTAQIENKIGNTLGRDSASATQGVNRTYMNKVASNREALGLPPQYGPPVMMRGQSTWEKIQPAIQLASLAMGVATFDPTSIGKGWKNFFTS